MVSQCGSINANTLQDRNLIIFPDFLSEVFFSFFFLFCILNKNDQLGAFFATMNLIIIRPLFYCSASTGQKQKLRTGFRNMTQIWEKDRYLTLTKHNRPCGSTSRELLVTDQLSRSFKPFSNQHDSVKEDREKGKKNMFRSENPHESLVSLSTYPFLPSNPGIQPKSFSKNVSHWNEHVAC